MDDTAAGRTAGGLVETSTGRRLAGNAQGAAVELIEVGGRKIAYRRAGGGHPLVLLHGAWSDGREWRPQLAELSDEFDVIAWDAPGCSPLPTKVAERASLRRRSLSFDRADVPPTSRSIQVV